MGADPAAADPARHTLEQLEAIAARHRARNCPCRRCARRLELLEEHIRARLELLEDVATLGRGQGAEPWPFLELRESGN